MSILKPCHKLLPAFLICAIIPLQLSAQTKPKNVSVLRFTAQNVSDTDAVIVSDLLSVALVKSGTYRVLDRMNMDKILKEQAFQQTGCTDSECAVQIGQLLNMDYMITGTLSKLGERYFITINIIGVETSQIVRSERTTGFVMDDVEKVIDDLSQVIIQDSPSIKKEPVATKAIPETSEHAKIKKSMRRNIKFTSLSGVLSIAGISLGYGMNYNTEKTYTAYQSTYDSEEARALGNKVDLLKTIANISYSTGEAGIILTSALGIWTIIDVLRLKRAKAASFSFAPVISLDNTGAILTVQKGF